MKIHLEMFIIFVDIVKFHEVKICITFVFSKRYRLRRRIRSAFRDRLVSGCDEALYRRRLCSSIAGPRSAPGQLHSLQELEETSDQGMSYAA